MAAKLFTQDDLQDSQFARALIVGPAKAGKTTQCVSTSPSTPFVINCDGDDALRYPTKILKAKVDGVHVHCRRDWIDGCNLAADRAEKGFNEIIIVDTLTLLCETLLKDCKIAGLRGYDVWQARDESVMEGFDILMEAPAHVLFIAHISARSDGVAGVLPVVGGKSLAEKLPQQVPDWIMFDIDANRDPMRCFALGPQKSWGASGRHLKGSKLIEADVGLLLEEMGFNGKKAAE